jgi:DNA mismatch endonuclease (patch repair protein)
MKSPTVGFVSSRFDETILQILGCRTDRRRGQLTTWRLCPVTGKPEVSVVTRPLHSLTTRKVRSQIMASVASSGNRSTERRMEEILRSNHITGFRKQWPVAGKPDFAWPKLKVACSLTVASGTAARDADSPSKSNVKFWRAKVLVNRRRDLRVSRKLRTEGWKVLRAWECVVTERRTLLRILRTITVVS